MSMTVFEANYKSKSTIKQRTAFSMGLPLLNLEKESAQTHASLMFRKDGL